MGHKAGTEGPGSARGNVEREGIQCWRQQQQGQDEVRSKTWAPDSGGGNGGEFGPSAGACGNSSSCIGEVSPAQIRGNDIGGGEMAPESGSSLSSSSDVAKCSCSSVINLAA
eukprot:g36684.t1